MCRNPQGSPARCACSQTLKVVIVPNTPHHESRFTHHEFVSGRMIFIILYKNNSMRYKIDVNSEIQPLKSVMVHRPDQGISRVTPKRSNELLFDDIVDYDTILQEHEIFTRILGWFIGPENVLEVEDLLYEILDEQEEVKMKMIEEVVSFEELPDRFLKVLSDLSSVDLVNTLIAG